MCWKWFVLGLPLLAALGCESEEKCDGGAQACRKTSAAKGRAKDAGSPPSDAAAPPDAADDPDATTCGDTKIDRLNCGACGHDCSAAGAAVSCESSRCVRTCRFDRKDCNGDLEMGTSGDGCETIGECYMTDNGVDVRDGSDAGPTPESCEPDTVGVRDDVVFMCDCRAPDGSEHSEMDYYTRYACVQRLTRPEDVAIVSPGNMTVKWEGEKVRAVYPTGVAFEVQIDPSNAGPSDPVGTGTNSYADFTCYRGSGLVLYQSDRWSCRDRYYCRTDWHP